MRYFDNIFTQRIDGVCGFYCLSTFLGSKFKLCGFLIIAVFITERLIKQEKKSIRHFNYVPKAYDYGKYTYNDIFIWCICVLRKSIIHESNWQGSENDEKLWNWLEFNLCVAVKTQRVYVSIQYWFQTTIL